MLFTADGTLLASTSKDETVRLWDMRTRRNIATLKDAKRSNILFLPQSGAIVHPAAVKEVLIVHRYKTFLNLHVNLNDVASRSRLEALRADIG